MNKKYEKELKLAEKSLCINCESKVKDFNLEFCCNGNLCGCYGYPVNVDFCLCDDCLPKFGWFKKN